MAKTIYALSSGSLPSGVAIVRISGQSVYKISDQIIGALPKPRFAELRSIKDPSTGSLLDEALVLFFPKPHSFTGEDVLEFHCHGGVATINAVLDCLSHFKDVFPAEAGEFSRRAFENGRLDLTELEGLSDLISAQTEAQRRQALLQSGGRLRRLYDGWREALIRCRALIEAELDFSDEEDVPNSVSQQVWSNVYELKQEIDKHLDDKRRGEITRDGYRIALMGYPNAGKSSLLNALADRDIAIVTPQAGTTRDVIEVSVRVGDHLVVIMDTAGFRKTKDVIEQEGIRRAYMAASSADLIVWLSAANERSQPPEDLKNEFESKTIVVTTKNDLGDTASSGFSVSTKKEDGLNPLLDFLEKQLSLRSGSSDDVLLTRNRHRVALQSCLEFLNAALLGSQAIELRSENLRQASDALGRLTGRIDVEDLLDVIFAEFCVGK